MTESIPPWQALHANLAEIMKGWKACHESTLGFHWKKLPPFSLIFPQVDFLRIQRMMETMVGHCDTQVKTLKKLQQGVVPGKEGAQLRLFYETMLPYVEAVRTSCSLLKEIASRKQDKLAQKKVGFKEMNKILLDYEGALHEMKTLAVPSMLAYHNLQSSINSTHP